MRISFLCVMVVFRFLHCMSLADQEFTGDDKGGNKVLVEKRYLTNNQIKNKFTKAWNRDVAMDARIMAAEAEIATFEAMLSRLETAESEITTLKANQEQIQVSMKVKCSKLDGLLDTGDDSTTQDCCQSDYYVLCLGRSSANLFAAFVKDPAGTCEACPESLLP